MKRGFTLVEMLVTVSIYVIIVGGIMDFFISSYKGAVQNPMALNSIDNVRSVTSAFANEIRSASYGNDGSYPLAQASSTQIIFFSPFGSPSTTTVMRIRYYLLNGILYKGITLPSGSPPSYNTANEAVRAVAYSVSSATSSIFYYYDGSYNGISSTTPIAQPVNVTKVTYVQMYLTTLMNEVRNATSTFSIATGAAIRNLKTNLGN
jgi:prepilin-type N-terminal cleavage/methylation domain-containing protein